MTEPFESKGVWWLPGNHSKRIYGNLKYDTTKGATLDLFGSLSEASALLLFDADIVLGELPDGKPVTLFGCIQSESNISGYALSTSAGFPISILEVDYVFEGEHFLTEADIKFKQLSIGLSHLRNWADAAHLRPSWDDGKVTVTCDVPDDIEVTIPNIGKLTFYYAAPISTSFKSATLQKDIGIKIEAEQPTSFDVWLTTIYLLRAFLSFATRHAVHPLYMEETKAIEIQLPSGETRSTYTRTDVFCRLSEIPEDSSTEGPRNMLFTLKDIDGNLELCLQNWFQKAELLKPVYDLYFGTLHNPTMYSIHEYSSLAQAIETYHRRTSNGSALPKAEFKRRMGEILVAAPEQYKDWLQEKLNFSNELSLRQRLEEIMQTYSGIFGQISNQEAFIKKVVDTRNYLTHYDKNSKKKAAHDFELYDLSQSLKILVEICLLKELGISNDKIRQIILRGQQDKHWFEHPTQI